MLSAVKLLKSVSTSGPSATLNPMPTNTSSSRSQAWVTMCACPRERRARCSVRSIASLAAAFPAAARSSATRRSATNASRFCIASLIARPVALRTSTSAIDPNDDLRPISTLPLPVCSLATRRNESTSPAAWSAEVAELNASAICSG